jgi:hypothetical protein
MMTERPSHPADTADPPVEHVVALLRERLYGAISCLATLAILTRYDTPDTNAWARVLDIAVSMGGLFAASLLSDFVAHLAVHQRLPHGRQGWHTLQASSQILAAAVLPMLVLAVAGIGLLDVETAMWIARWVLVAELGLIVLLAVRRTALPWWQKVLAVVALLIVGVAVIGIKVLAH